MRPSTFVIIAILPSVLAVSCSSAGTTDEPQEDALAATQILNRMGKTYAECQSYRDSGLVKIVFFDSNGKRTVEKPFTTAFVRPDQFRFEYKEKVNNQEFQCIIWRKRKEVRAWRDVKSGIKRLESLDLALARATGVSSGSAHTIPALLLPDDIVGRRLTNMTEAKQLEDAKHDNIDCFRIQGQFGSSSMTIWIDKKTLLVRRIDSPQKFDDFRTEKTTTYEPVINGGIEDKLLEFDPPRPD